MSTAVMPRPQQAVSRFEQREMVETLKQTVCKGANDAQFKMFIEVCKATGLDPFLKEIWFVASSNLIMAGRDGYLRVANEHPQFDGMETRVERDEKKLPVKATCTVWRKDRSHPIVCEAYYNEYKKTTPVWTQYPSAMISKVAEVLALKRSFAINGVVTEEEIGNPAEERKAAKQAQQDVAAAKIAAMKSGKTYTEVSEPVEVIDAETVPEENEPQAPPVQETASGSIKARLEQFAAMKERIGKDAYYRIMGAHGYEHANQVRNISEARAIYREMLEEEAANKQRE